MHVNEIITDTIEVFIVNTGCIYDIGERERVGRPGTMKTGPNDASFFKISFILFDTNQYLLHIQAVNYKIDDTERDQSISSLWSTTTTIFNREIRGSRHDASRA